MQHARFCEQLVGCAESQQDLDSVGNNQLSHILGTERGRVEA